MFFKKTHLIKCKLQTSRVCCIHCRRACLKISAMSAGSEPESPPVTSRIPGALIRLSEAP